MSTAFDAVREILSLTENVRGLRDDVVGLARSVDSVRERLIRLESREEVLIEKTRNAAIMSVTQMHSDLLKRLFALESLQGTLVASTVNPTRLPATSSTRGEGGA
jgi:hypothetical protein